MGALRFSSTYALLAILVLCIEIIIALFVKDRIVRPFVGDVLAIILVYLGLKTFISGYKLQLAIIALSIAFFIEGLQAFNFIEIIGLEENKLARVLLGTSFDWRDIGCYVLGAFIIIIFERRCKTNGLSRYT